MLVQTALQDVLRDVGGGYVGFVLCSRCGKDIGPVSRGEMQHLLSASTSPLCFNCEDVPPQPTVMIGAEVKHTLLRVFDLGGLDDLPLHGASAWRNAVLDVDLQLSPNYGWCLWYTNPDGQKVLQNVRLSHDHAQEYRMVFELSPVTKVR